MSTCCASCFQNAYIRNFIRKKGTLGDCSYCQKERVKGIDPILLQEIFKPVVELYEPVEEGEHYSREGIRDVLDFDSLGDLIDDEWRVFSTHLDIEVRNKLLDDIRLVGLRQDEMMYEPVSSGPWATEDDRLFSITPEQTWKWFADHLKRERRFIFDYDGSGEIVRPEEWIGKAITELNAIQTISPYRTLYRARKGYVESGKGNKKEPIPPSEMGAPPSNLARASRGNCEGIAMFYAAFDERTAVAEAGRFPGATVSVRPVKAKKKLRLADLTAFQGPWQPFGITNLRSYIRHSRMLNQLNIELARPVHPDDSAIEYLPTQYLSEAIRDAEFDGICYRSSLNHDGTNVVIFDPENMRVCRKGKVAEIENITLKISID